MQAIVWTAYGSPEVLQVTELEKPTPKDNEVLIKVHASTVTAGDCRMRSLDVPRGFGLPFRLMFGLSKPRISIPGMEVSGEIEAVGKDVTLFEVGDCVYGTAGMSLGAYAEYICIPEKAALVKMPDNVSHEQAVAAIFGGLTAIHFLRDQANLQSGQKVLINGASGAVGTASIQLANYFGSKVTGICSTANIELVKSLGANKVFDYTQEDFVQISGENRETYDVILDAVGNLSFASCRELLTEQGKLILVNGDLPAILSSIFRKNVIGGAAAETKENLTFLRERLEAGDFAAVIDRTYPLEEIVEAHRYVDTGRKKGNVVLSLDCP